jgi:hypothetical protein
VSVCPDQRGPESAKSFPGQELVHALPDPDGKRPAERATQQVDDARRGKGDIFGAFKPADGEAFTKASDRRTIANWVDFLGCVDAGIPAELAPVYAIADNLNVHRATDVLLFSLAHPRGEFICTPQSAAYLNLIEPWGKILRSLALKGRRFATWAAVVQAVKDATAYWNKQRHPFLWGRRRRHQPRRRSGVGLLPRVA